MKSGITMYVHERFNPLVYIYIYIYSLFVLKVHVLDNIKKKITYKIQLHVNFD